MTTRGPTPTGFDTSPRHSSAGTPRSAARTSPRLATARSPIASRNAPGGPVHVLLTDTVAEHVPGCNMAFRRDRLAAIGGFDPVYRTAGDDVDACWRIQQAGGTIGFSPAAMVWHHRRNSVRTYWKQQQGYGRAEALLERKWPEKYNSLGHVSWAGRLYGKGLTAALAARGGRLYGGTWGTAAYQSLYGPGGGGLLTLPLMPEWYLLVAALGVLSLLGLSWPPLLLAVPLLVLAVAAPLVQAGISAGRASFTSEPPDARARLRLRSITFLLHLLQPLARLRGRIRHGLAIWRLRDGAGRFAVPVAHRWTVWHETWRSPEATLEATERRLRDAGGAVLRGGDFDPWDLELRAGVLASARLVSGSEEHGSGRQLARFRVWPNVSVPGAAVIVGLLVLAVGAFGHPAPLAGLALAAAALALLARMVQEAGLAVGGLRASVAAAAASPERRRMSNATGTRAAPRRSDVRLYGRLLWDARRYWPHLAVEFLVELAAMPLALLTPLALAIVLDTVIGGAPPPAFLPAEFATPELVLGFAAVLFIVVAALTQLQVLGSKLLQTFIGERLTLEFRTRLFAQMQRLSFTYHDTAGTSDALYRIQYDAPAIDWVAVHGFTPFITAGATLIAMIYVTARIDPQLAVIAVAITPALVILAVLSRRTVRRRWDRFKSLESSSFSVIHEVLGNLRVVKGFGQEEREEDRFSDASRTTLSARLKVSTAEGMLEFLATVTTAVGTALVLFVGAMNVRSGSMSVGDLVLIMGYMTQLYAPLRTMAQSVTTLQASLASAERAYAVLDRARDVHDAPGAQPLGRARGDVAFEGVSFAYQPGQPVLRDASLRVAAGSRVGIQGVTGSGKTTVVNLLMRFYDPSAGRITLDGLDTRAYRLDDLRNQFALVLQEPLLFSRTIAENIAYARPDATEEEIEVAAALANADGFIRDLSDGYATVVGERGMTLSGGERQRISLARAFLKDAPILILDEPTSSLDVQTETQIIEAMERLMAGRTTFMIAHRLSTLASCDVRVEIDDGRMVLAEPSTTPPSWPTWQTWPEAATPQTDASFRAGARRPSTFGKAHG